MKVAPMEVMSSVPTEPKIDKTLYRRLKSNWEREPSAATELIIALGTCTLYTTHEEVALMQLKDKNLEYSSLLVNLDQLSTLGSKAFSQASVDARIFSERANRIAKKRGLADQAMTEAVRFTATAAAAVAVTGVSIAIAPLAVGAAAVGGVYLAYCKSKEARHKVYRQDLDRAQGEVDQLANRLKECTQNLEQAKLALKSAQTSAEKWTAVKKAASTVTSQMANIHSSFSETMQYFTELNTELKLFSEAYQQSYEDAMESPDDEDSELNLWNLEEEALTMKCHAQVVYSLSAFHAEIYDMYIREGFNLIASFRYPHNDERGLCSEELGKRRQGRMTVFLQEAQKGIRNEVYKGKLQLFNETKILYPQLTDASELRPKLLE